MSAFRYRYDQSGEEEEKLWNCANSTEFLYHCQYLLNTDEPETFNDRADIETTPTSVLLKIVRVFHGNAQRQNPNPKWYEGYEYENESTIDENKQIVEKLTSILIEKRFRLAFCTINDAETRYAFYGPFVYCNDTRTYSEET